MGMGMTLFMEAFVTIHMSVFVLLPLSKLISKDNSRKIFWTLFGVRIAILLFFDFFITTGIAIVDFMAVFVGAFIVTPIAMKKGVWNQKLSKQSGKEKVQTAAEAVIHAPAADETVTGRIVHAEDFDPLFAMSEEDCVEGFIKREMQRAGITEEQNLIPEDMLRRKNILNAVLAVLLFVYISLFFFHFPMKTYVIGLIILVVYAFLTSRYQLIKYLKKEIRSRSQEKISNIVMNVKASMVPDYSKKLKWTLMAVAVAGSLLLFSKPRIFYEQSDDGYYVRFYVYGLTNMTTAIIPDTYQGEKVVGLRGNTFSNMPFLSEVTLPDSITEIRGNTFEECSSLLRIEIPDNVTRIGGHAFYGNTSLEEVVISPDSKLQQIGSSAFRCCDSLREITLPRGVSVNERAFKETPVRIDYYEY